MENTPDIIRRLRSALLCALLIGGSALAQTSPLPSLNALAAAEKAAEARTIAVGDLPRRLAEESAFIARVVQRNTSPAGVQDEAGELAQLTANVDALGQRLVGKAFATLPLSGLESLERHLVFLGGRLGQLQDELQARTRPLSEGAGELAQRRKIWRDTRLSSAELIPPTLLASIDTLDNDFQAAADQLARPLAALLKLNHEASILQARIGDSLLSVRSQIGRAGRQLWTVDSDSLWAVLRSASAQSDGSLQALINGYAIQSEFVAEYDRAYRGKHLLLFVLALCALPAFVYLSRWAARIVADDGDALRERYRVTLGRPISAWLLFSIMCWLLADAGGPAMRRALLLALAWLPAMRLQPQSVNDALGRWKYASLVFVAVSFLGLLVSTFPLIFRPLLLVNSLLLLVTLVMLLRRWPATWSSPRASRALLVAYLLPVAAALVGNVVGSVHLAVLLTEATIASVYLFVVLFALREFVAAYAQIVRLSGAIERRATQASRLFEVAFSVFNLALGAVWLIGTLSVFRVLRLVSAQLTTLAQRSIEVGSISLSVGGVVLFCVSVLLSFRIARTLRSVLAEDVLPGMTLPRGVANSVSTMSYYLLLLLGLLIALSAAGFELSQLALVLGALSVGIGFGLNTVVNNFVGGLILMIERPIQPGDSVEFSGTTGKVREIGIRTTTLSTFDGADVIIPNGLLLSEKLVNWTFNNERRRIELAIGVAYGSAPRRVQAILLDVASRLAGVSHEPPPVALFTGFGESSLDFCVRAWTDEFDRSQAIRSELAIAVLEALQAAGIEIPFPQRELRIRSIDAGVASAAAAGDVQP